MTNFTRLLGFTGLAVGAVAGTACGSVAMQAGGSQFSLSSREATVAAEYERGAPHDLVRRCEYWKGRIRQASSAHVVGGLSWPADYFETLAQWTRARADESCKGGAHESDMEIMESLCFNDPDSCKDASDKDSAKKGAEKPDSALAGAVARSRIASACGARFDPPARKYLKKDAFLLLGTMVLDMDPRFTWNSGAGKCWMKDCQVPVPWPPDRLLPFPRGAAFETLQILPGKDGVCSFALVRRVGAPDRYDSLVVGALGWFQADPPLDEKTESAKADRLNAARALIEEEKRTGRCSDGHADELKRALDGMKQTFSGGADLTLIAHKLVVAKGKDAAAEVEFHVGLGGEYHVFALGIADPLELEVRDQQGYPVTTESPLLYVVRTSFGLLSHGRQLEANTGDDIKAIVRGHGCALVAVFSKL